MELSIVGDLDVIRRRVLDMSPLPVGSVPVYQAAIERIRKDGSVVYMEEEDLFKTIEKQAKDGIDFMAVHSSINIETLTRLKRQGRVTGLVSRGGSFMSGWIVENEKENPLYSNFDYVLEIAKEHDVVLSLANGMRAGSIADSTEQGSNPRIDHFRRTNRQIPGSRVQCMIEGPGHIQLTKSQQMLRMIQKKMCSNAPFYMLDLLWRDVAPGYDLHRICNWFCIFCKSRSRFHLLCNSCRTPCSSKP